MFGNFTGRTPEHCPNIFMDIRPKPHVAKKLKEMAQKEGISYNAMLVPYLNDIAAGLLKRSPHYVAPVHGQKAA
jgi:predicted HicB family RNase H-like nuclease